MKVQLTAKFFLDNGEVKRVDRYEVDAATVATL